MIGDDPRVVPSVWPALAALFTVVLLSFAMFGFDIVIDRNTASHTDSLVGDSLRSVALADDLRYQAYRLSVANLSPDQIASIAEQIDSDARAYDPLATSDGEGDEWNRLQGLLAHLRHEQPLPTNGSSTTLVDEIETSIARLVAINQAEARRAARAIGDAHRNGLVLDGVLGSITLVCVALVGLVLIRTLRRQRALLQLHLTSLDERTKDLAAFAARAAHDLKGPLNPIRGYADLLKLKGDPEVRDLAGRIGNAVTKMTGVIEEMLAFSTSGQPARGSAEIAIVVIDTIDELRGELGDASVACDVGGGGELRVVLSPSALGQVMRNLLSNAAKYRSPDRRLAVHIAAQRLGDRASLAVTDNGIGMTAEIADHVFEPSYRAPGTAATGHGLGLAIVRRTVEAAGGSVTLSSRLGEGTKVTVNLPALG